MKNAIRFSSFILIFSGILLTPFVFGNHELLTLIHIVLGFVYAVIFLLFSIDHVSTHKDDLFQKNLKNFAGLSQIVLGAVILGSGFVIYLFGSQPISPWTEIHLWGTILFLVSSSLHFFTK